MIQNKERRLHPRIDQELPLKLQVNGYDFKTTTENVSCVGTYCHIDKYVPPFTKIYVKMRLPVRSGRLNRDSDVQCKGVIVRTEDLDAGGYKVAIFFNDIKDDQKQRIARYVNQFLPK